MGKPLSFAMLLLDETEKADLLFLSLALSLASNTYENAKNIKNEESPYKLCEENLNRLTV